VDLKIDEKIRNFKLALAKYHTHSIEPEHLHGDMKPPPSSAEES
jgi:hypothetical protein